MKILLMSDSHGLTKEVQQVVDDVKADHIIHCGDFCVDSNLSPFKKMTKVRGNCDFDTSEPLQRILHWQGLKVLLTHGHKYRVKESLLSLSYLAAENDTHVVLFGHSHVPLTIFEHGRLLINPGSIAQPRGYPKPTFALMEINRKENQFEIIIEYYDLNYEKRNDLSGKYTISI